MSTHVVVVGHGMVGHRFVRTLTERGTDADLRITVFGEEFDQAYDRVALSSYVGGWDRTTLHLAGSDHADDPRVTLRPGYTVTKVDPKTKEVELDDGSTVSYDRLVLATGSRAFVPPVPGHDLPGCHVYRTLDDLDAIRAATEAAGPCSHGIVVGGGLLGLEAANALAQLGLHPHVVERSDRLMPVQVDDGGGRVLADLIRGRDIDVHLGITDTSIAELPGGGVRVHLTDAEDTTETVDAACLVFSAGVRPRDELARVSALDCAERGGILTDSACRTSVEDVWAIGECAAIEGVCYGLVGPGYASAEVVAEQILGRDSRFPGADLATKLKLLGVDVASFGDAHGTTPGCRPVVVSDPVGGSYSSLVLDADGVTLLGGCFVGDAGPYATLKPLLGRTLPSVNPIALLTPESSGSDSGIGVESLPDDAQVCSCNAVTKGELREAICDGACDVAGLKACTRAGTSCGSCVPLMRRVLEAEGVEQSTALCEHFTQSRAELFDIVRVTGIRTFAELVERFGTGAGCEVCKPTVGSILASTSSEHILDGEAASLQDTNDHFLANLQKNGTYSVVPRMAGGEVSAEHLIVIGEIARDHDLYVKVTGGQRIDMFGARVEELPAIWSRLVDAGMESGHAYGKSLRTVKSCVGSTWCRYGQQDSVGMAVRLELRYRGLRAPHKIKMGVSGCARECAEARAKDIGVIATETGWNLYVGGNGGATPRHAELFAAELTDDELLRYIDRILMFYIRTGERLQRIAPWLEALEGGMDRLREVVVDDALDLGDELDRRMITHVDGYVDEWSAVLEDPEKLARFVSFVNAPEAPDPTVEFTERDGRTVPVLMPLPAMPGTHPEPVPV